MQMNLFVSSFSFKSVVLLAGLALTALTGAQSSNQPQLSPAFLLPGDATIGNAAGSQGGQRISKGTNGYLVVWHDGRGALNNSYYSEHDLPFFTELLAARLDVVGNIIDSAPISITRNRIFSFQPDIAWNGQHWLITWQESILGQSNCLDCYVLRGVRVSAEGNVVDPVPIQIGLPYESYSVTDLASDGSNWVVTKLPPQNLDGGEVRVIRIQPDGQVLGSEERVVARVPNSLRAVGLDVAFAGDEYLVIWGEGQRTPLSGIGTHWLKAQRLSLTLEPLGEQFTIGHPKLAENLIVNPRLASDGTDFMVVWLNEVRMVSHNGQIISEPLSIWGHSTPFELCWDGMEYVAAARDHNGFSNGLELVSYRFNRSGTWLGISEVSAAWNYDIPISIAPRFGGGAQFVLVDRKPIPRIDDPGLTISIESELITAGVRPDGTVSSAVTIPKSAPRQSQPNVIASSNGFLLIYRSQVLGNAKILAQRLDANGLVLDQEPIVIASGHPGLKNPSVAWNGSVYLVAWEKSQTPSGLAGYSLVYGRRLTPTGLPLGEEFVVTQGVNPGVSSLNDQFLVVANQVNVSNAVRVAADGRLLGATTLQVQSYPRVVALGGNWVVAWANESTSPGTPVPPCVQGVFISANGVSTAPFIISDFPANTGCHGLQLAVTGNEMLAIYGGRLLPFDPGWLGGILGRRMRADGSFVGPGFTVSSQGFWPTAVGDGSYLAVWLDPRKEGFFPSRRGDIFGARIGSNSEILDPQGFALADTPVSENHPSIASRNGVAVFAYSGYVPQAPFNTPRIHLRVIRGAFSNLPIIPTNLAADSATWNQVVLTWQDNASNETGFKIERCAGQNCTNFSEVASINADVTSFTDSRLSSNTWFRYRVRAFNADGASGYSNIVQAQTLEAPSFSITGRLTDRDGRGLEGYSVTLTGSLGGFARTDRSGYYRLSSVPGGVNYRVTVQSPGPRIGFTTYYPNPGWIEFNYLATNQSANFAYNLTSPWTPPGATPTPTPTPVPTPTPTPPPGNDGMILNPNFDQAGANWTAAGAVSFANGIARLTPTSTFSPASILQWVQLTPGATFEVSADITATSTARLTLGVRFDDGGNVVSGPSIPITNVTRSTTVRLRFTVPNAVSQVGFFAQANGSVASGSLATADNFRLARVN